jgi:hypothetical protein
MRRPDDKLDEIIIHIGTEKTGTTAIQEFLRDNRRRLAKRGLLYPKSLGRAFGSQVELLGVAHKSPWRHDFGKVLGIGCAADQHQFEQNLIDVMRRELAHRGRVNRILFSSEHFHSRPLEIERIRYLKDFLSPFTRRFRIIVYFRRQDEVGFSYQSTRLKSLVDVGRLDLRLLLVAPPGYYDYAMLYENWASVFGDEAIIPSLYQEAIETRGGLIQHFLHSCEVPSERLSIVSRKLNRSLDLKGFHFLRALNQLYPLVPGDRSDKTRIALNKEIERLFPGNYRPIDREQIIDWYKPYARVNERLRRVAFPNRAEELFDSSFSEYPVKGESKQLSFEDAVTVAYELWKANYDEGRDQVSIFRRAVNRLKRIAER